jgi:6-phosphofructokinase 1
VYGVPIRPEELTVATLGARRFHSPLALPEGDAEGEGGFLPDSMRVRYDVVFDRERQAGGGGEGGAAAEPLAFEKAGPRAEIYFDPPRTRAAIVTCGGLCPGTNNVIRSLFNELYYRYGVKEVLGVRYGFQGLSRDAPVAPVELTPELVSEIHALGGTVLGSSRESHPPSHMVDFIDRGLGADVLFCVGGDGSQRGAHAIAEEVGRRGLKIAVVGVPKTIDNDIPFVWRSFGFYTALEKAREVIQGAHVEASGVPNGIGLVQLMGRDAGFIAAGATLASQEVNFTLIPEVPFELDGDDGLLAALERRLAERGHAVVVVAEGAGQHLFATAAAAGGTAEAAGGAGAGPAAVAGRAGDIGLLLRERIARHFRQRGIAAHLKYFDPSYLIRSVPANTGDSLLCDSLARHAVHAGMAGKTDLLIGFWHNDFIHVPIPAVICRKKMLSPTGGVWIAVLSATGQPARFGSPAPAKTAEPVA